MYAFVSNSHRNGAVRFESVMRLRNKLDELRKMEGVKSADKGCLSGVETATPKWGGAHERQSPAVHDSAL